MENKLKLFILVLLVLGLANVIEPKSDDYFYAEGGEDEKGSNEQSELKPESLVETVESESSNNQETIREVEPKVEEAPKTDDSQKIDESPKAEGSISYDEQEVASHDSDNEVKVAALKNSDSNESVDNSVEFESNEESTKEEESAKEEESSNGVGAEVMQSVDTTTPPVPEVEPKSVEAEPVAAEAPKVEEAVAPKSENQAPVAEVHSGQNIESGTDKMMKSGSKDMSVSERISAGENVQPAKTSLLYIIVPVASVFAVGIVVAAVLVLATKTSVFKKKTTTSRKPIYTSVSQSDKI